MTKRLRYPPQEVRTNQILWRVAHKSFALYPYLGCDITLYGNVSPTDGKVLPREIRYHHPNFSADGSNISAARENYDVKLN